MDLIITVQRFLPINWRNVENVTERCRQILGTNSTCQNNQNVSENLRFVCYSWKSTHAQNILHVDRDVCVSMRQVGKEFSVSHMTIWRVLNGQLLYAYNLHRVQGLMPLDFPARETFFVVLFNEMLSNSLFHQRCLHMRHASVETRTFTANTSGQACPMYVCTFQLHSVYTDIHTRITMRQRIHTLSEALWGSLLDWTTLTYIYGQLTDVGILRNLDLTHGSEIIISFTGPNRITMKKKKKVNFSVNNAKKNQIHVSTGNAGTSVWLNIQYNYNYKCRILTATYESSGRKRGNKSLNSILLTYSRSWGLLEEPPIVQPLKNFPTFYGTRRFNTVFTRALLWSLSWVTWIQSTPSHPL
jgi:hypothetical protein